MRVIDQFDAGVRLGADRPCLTELAGRSLTYGEVCDLTHRIANGLKACGLQRGAKVGLLSGNHLLTFAAMLGTFRSDTILVPVNARNAMSENIYVLANTDCEFLWIDAEFAAHIPEIRAGLPGIKMIVSVTGPVGDVPGIEEWAALQSPDLFDFDYDPEDIFTIRGTGGTTGMPKAVLIPHRAWQLMFANAFITAPFRVRPVNLVVMPLSHASATSSLMTVTYGGENVILPKADPDTILGAIEKFKVTFTVLPPTVIYRLLASQNLKAFDLSSLEYLAYASAPISTEKLKEAIDVFGPVLVQFYGQAEAPLTLTTMTREDHITNNDPVRVKRLASCGRASPYVHLEIMDEAGLFLPNNERGELVVRGGLVMKGYYKNPDATAEAMRDGWLHTGDVAYRDDDGYYFLVDRKKDVIISGGFNIYPGEIEQVIARHPAVLESAVIGIPDPDWGESLKAVVELRPGMQVSESDLLAHCRQHLGKLKIPRSIEFWPELPRTRVGKILKRDIRQKFWGESQRAV
ncbi:AMP-binding protein [soil metagenome]